MPMLRYAAEAIGMLGIAWGIVKWVGRAARDVADGTSASTDPLGLRPAGAEPATLDMVTMRAAARRLRERGLVTEEQLARMSPREIELLVRASAERLGDTPDGQPVRFTAPNPVPPAPRAVGLDVFCPSCGTALAREVLQTSGRVRCHGCSREVAAFIRRGRLTVIVHETSEERARRARVDSDVA